MTRSPDEMDQELAALEAELEADPLPDPGSAFFAELKERVMDEVAQRPVPRRSWWQRLGELGRWGWRPAPVAALAGAAALVLVALLLSGDRGAEQTLGPPVGFTGIVPDRGPETDAPRKAPAPSGARWLARLPPTDDLWAMEDDRLPALLALLSEEMPDGGDDDEPAPGEPVNEQSLERLNDTQLRLLEQELRESQPQKPRRRPAPSMRRSG